MTTPPTIKAASNQVVTLTILIQIDLLYLLCDFYLILSGFFQYQTYYFFFILFHRKNHKKLINPTLDEERVNNENQLDKVIDYLIKSKGSDYENLSG